MADFIQPNQPCSFSISVARNGRWCMCEGGRTPRPLKLLTRGEYTMDTQYIFNTVMGSFVGAVAVLAIVVKLF